MEQSTTTEYGRAHPSTQQRINGILSPRIISVVLWLCIPIIALVIVLASCQPVRRIEQGTEGAGDPELAANPQPPADSPDGSEPVAKEPIDAGVADSESGLAITSVRNSSTTDDAKIAAGLLVYRKQYCGICHELAAAETTGRFGPAHDGISETALSRVSDPDYTGEAVTAADYLFESIVAPDVYVVPGYAVTANRMPPYSHLPEAELEVLVVFLLAQH